MQRVTVVGAGLAGLVAAINLAREGREVRVLEREKRIGGMPEFRPDPAGGPFDLEGIKRYTGVDIAPAVKPIEELRLRAWGRWFDIPVDVDVGLYMVERGSRESSIDSLLLKEALKAGVTVDFDHPVLTPREYADLPPGTIVTTGLKAEPFEALGIPYSLLYGFYARGTVDHDRTTVSVLMDTFTRDYGFYSTMNGVSFALLFQKEVPLSREGCGRFRGLLEDGVCERFSQWQNMTGAWPTGGIRNPRLFHGNKILAGTVSGAVDPFLYFGMLGALVSGRIAARAVEDRAGAWRDFRKTVLMFYPTYINKMMWDLMPDLMKSGAIRTVMAVFPYAKDLLFRIFAQNMPGWRLTGVPDGVASWVLGL